MRIKRQAQRHWDVEIEESAGAENIYTFGKDSESIIKLYETAGLCLKAYYETTKRLKEQSILF